MSAFKAVTDLPSCGAAEGVLIWRERRGRLGGEGCDGKDMTGFVGAASIVLRRREAIEGEAEWERDVVSR